MNCKYNLFNLLIISLLTLFAFPALANAQAPQLEFQSRILENALSVDSVGNYAYVTNGALKIIDITDISSPNEVGSYNIDGCGLNSIVVTQNVAYVTQEGSSLCKIEGSVVRDSVHVIDVSSPNSPVETGWEDITGTGVAVEISENGQYIYVAFAQGGLKIMDITDVNNPVVLGNFNPGFDFRDVVVNENIAYLAATSGHLFLVDVSDSANPIEISRYNPPVPSNATGVDVVGNTVYLAYGIYGLRIIDVSDKPSPFEVGSINWRLIPFYNGGILDVKVSGNYAVLADGSEGVRVVDVSDPTNPVEVASYIQRGSGATARKIEISDQKIFVANGSGGLLILKYDKLPDLSVKPFLRLPWDYEAFGMSFNEAALAINAYFDHEYPLLSTGLGEPGNTTLDVVAFYPNLIPLQADYSSHDGYDWGSDAKTKFGVPQLAAADGVATFHNECGACGNAIHIDHGNGYQTRYYHLQPEGLIVDKPGVEAEVIQGQQIGLTGFSGSVIPAGEQGAHIHFMVVNDKNGDGNFDDNIPDGLTDPFGWQSSDPDPWQLYEFSYLGQQRTGSPSYYLWQDEIEKLSDSFDSNGGYFELNKFAFDIPSGATDENLSIQMQSAPIAEIDETKESVGSTLSITVKDSLGNIITTLDETYTLYINYNTLDLSKFDINSLAIYTSEDGVTWMEEESENNIGDKIMSAHLTHFSHFALVADKLDTTPPETGADLSGEEGNENWFRSDVGLTLSSSDDFSDISYTAYKLANGEWQKYDVPLIFTSEGQHTVEYYSEDEVGNIEDVKTVTFYIDKTLPTGTLLTSIQDIWPPNGKTFMVSIDGYAVDDNGYVEVNFSVEDEYDIVEPEIYNFGDTIELEAKRRGNDPNGRTYTIHLLITDQAGNIISESKDILVLHDQGNDVLQELDLLLNNI